MSGARCIKVVSIKVRHEIEMKSSHIEKESLNAVVVLPVGVALDAVAAGCRTGATGDRDDAAAPGAGPDARPFAADSHMEPNEEQSTEMGATTTAAAAAGPVVGTNGSESSPPPRKRLKLTLADDAVALRKRILEHKLIRLKNMRERLTEQLSELYFLQAGGNMMDYAAWRKRPPTPQLLAFLDARRPPALVSGSASALAPAVPHPTSSVSSPSGPVPVSSAVTAPTLVPVQTPRLPNGTGEDKRHAALVVRTQSGGAAVHQSQKQQDSTLLDLDVAASTGAPTASLASNNAQEEIVEKAKQEAYVARRVAELARAGLWTERRLPRVLEPPRPKTHWDYLLEEMAWLAQDFANERKWKKHAAKKASLVKRTAKDGVMSEKEDSSAFFFYTASLSVCWTCLPCARMVQKHFQDKAMAAQRAEKAHELQLRRIAAFAAKEIKSFWANIEKVVEWKRSVRLERARKAALDEQLSYIVDRTERYSQQLAAGMSHSATSSIGVPPSDDEFEPGSGSGSSDDEETIAAAERDNTDTRDEVDALRRESRLELRDVLRTLPPGYRPGAPPSPPASAASSASVSVSASASRASSPAPSDYSAAGDNSTDDETTIAEEERTETADTTAELDALRRESEMSIEDLLRNYHVDGEVAPATPATPAIPAIDTHSDTDDEADADSSTSDDDDSDAASEHSSAPSETLEALVAEPSTEDANNKGTNGGAEEERVQAAAALAATLQPTGTTLSETAVGTPVPRLLRGGALREYQHVGLHWLATMHARGLNGILADEMGLGKTIQTIALLTHLALERGDWGPHLVIAPTSLVLNWELEFKKWCPAFKLLTYYGTIKERKLKRVGWTKANCFHVCITSYKLVVQDHQSFRRKRWKYLILDEAQNIKNFKSQRWQMLLNFQTERRLLLTGTPLQNSLLELWSLMHFLMPDVFASHSEFREWFAPVAGIAEGSHKYNEDIVRRLHKVLRPFLLRRLKADVERQMPRKYEHVLLCRLSKRQRYLYDDFMSRAKTKESLASGNLLSVINVLMQLRKVCNHPDLFEPRAVHSPLQLSAIELRVPAFLLLSNERSALAATLGGDLATLEATGAEAFVSHRARHLAPPRRLIEELPADEAAHTPPPPPPVARKLRLHLRLVARTPAARLTAPRVAPAPLHLPVPLPGPSPPSQPLTQPAATRPYSSYNEAYAARLEARRRASLRRLGAVNERRCWRLPLYGADLRAAAAAPLPTPVDTRVAPPFLDEFVTRLIPTLERFSVCWAAARAPAPQLVVGTGAAVWRRHVARLEERAALAAQPLLRVLHLPALLQSVAFPHPRLLQYDCGKLQTLDALLRRLKLGGHRVLIFTQMTRVLDVLEAFLSMHGHTYLRLDGATRVDRRQPLVDRFNSDPRLFAFILSTRSGGVGLNLAGADCVIFYDSDWNPTMDAQAQDRCHRIGQTRDVHVYRLVTAATVEENILRKAEQKRALGHLAIEDGHFTTSYLRAANIHELFGEGAAPAANPSSAPADLESALAAAEDEADAAAANAARAEAQRDLAEFDETLPLATDDGEDGVPVAAPDDDQPRELRTLLQQILAPNEGLLLCLILVWFSVLI
ncbi:Helicase domino [Eumeta japonica]|uniref:Helicase domino n=1 Tax=Eumeta variegata TaxID=151549 RepID=A0A4C1XJK1_EUMVA|nr:Helicase domino [Eumeta japonica]